MKKLIILFLTILLSVDSFSQSLAPKGLKVGGTNGDSTSIRKDGTIHQYNNGIEIFNTDANGIIYGNGSGLTGITSSQVGAATSSTIHDSLSNYASISKVTYMIDTAINSITIDTSQVTSIYQNSLKLNKNVNVFTTDYLRMFNNTITASLYPSIVLKNHTISTAGVPIHCSPAVDFKGTAYNTSSTLNENHFWRIGVLPTSANPTNSKLIFYSSSDSITWTERFSVNNAGILNASSILSTGVCGTTGSYLQCTRGAIGASITYGLLMQNATASTGVAPVQNSSTTRFNGTWWDGTASRTSWAFQYSTGVANTQKMQFITGNSTDVGGIYNKMFILEDIRNLTSSDNMLLNRGLYNRRLGFTLNGVNSSVRLQSDTLKTSIITDQALVIGTDTKANIDGGSPSVTEIAKFNSTGITVTKYFVTSLNAEPSSSSDTGTAGEIRFTANYIYICTATNTWKRVAISTW